MTDETTQPAASTPAWNVLLIFSDSRPAFEWVGNAESAQLARAYAIRAYQQSADARPMAGAEIQFHTRHAVTAIRTKRALKDRLDLGRVIYRDLETGLPITEHESGHWMYLTPCCTAAASANEGGTYCKKCYRYVDDTCGAVGPDLVRLHH